MTRCATLWTHACPESANNAGSSDLELDVGWVEPFDPHSGQAPRYPSIDRWTAASVRLYNPPVTSYRRNFIPGGTFFFTVNLSDRRSSLLTERADLLRTAFRFVRARHAFTVDAIVVLPEHVHTIWTLPPGDADFATRWRLIKTMFSRAIEAGEQRSPSRESKGERGLWQRRYWEHTLRDEIDFERHCNYIHFNPVKHGYVLTVSEWPYSSFQRFVRLGLYPADWAAAEQIEGDEFGER